MISVSGGGVTPLESETYSYERAFEAGGLSDAEKRQAGELLSRYFDYLASGASRDELVEQIERAKETPWYRLAPVGDILPSGENRLNWQWVATFDPAPYVSRFTFPVLLLFGELDREQPTELAVQKWESALRAAGNRRFTTRIFPGANHWLRPSDPHEGAGEHHQSAPPAEVLETVIQWLKAEVIGVRPSALVAPH